MYPSSLELTGKEGLRMMVAEKVGAAGGKLEVFKKPDAPPPPKKKKTVLEEDKYAEGLEDIIQRDFFPDLEKLKAQNAYLHAVENNDIHMIRELYTKYGLGRGTPRPHSDLRETPSTFETPSEFGDKNSDEPTPTHIPMETSDMLKSEEKDIKEKRKQMSLNAYLDKYTSEDNQSFTDIMENSDKRHRLQHSWLFEAEEKHRLQQAESLALPSMEKQALQDKETSSVDTWTYKNKNYIMYIPDGVAFTPEEEIELAKKKPEVNTDNTRFVKVPYKDVNPQASGSTPTPTPASLIPHASSYKKPEGKIGVDGKEVESSITPKVNGFSIVRTPSPTPGVEESPFMTWGEIEGTPFRLDGSDTPIPANPIKPFKMNEQSKREKIALELAEKASKMYRDRKQKALDTARTNLSSKTPRPSTSSERLSTISPAARKFAISIGSRVATDKSLRASYTPNQPQTPKTPFSSQYTPTPGSSSSRSTRSTTSNTSSKSQRSTTPAALTSLYPTKNLTDGLLKLPSANSDKSKRSKAQEFF